MANHKIDKWRALQHANYIVPLTDAEIDEAMLAYAEAGRPETREQVVADLELEATRSEYWLNDVYQVQKRDLGNGMIHLNIRRRDGKPILRDWRHFQKIKNELVGEECEAVELYPAESRLSDTSNKYHLWAIKDPAFRFPFGMQGRDVQARSGSKPGYRQRRFA